MLLWKFVEKDQVKVNYFECTLRMQVAIQYFFFFPTVPVLSENTM